MSFSDLTLAALQRYKPSAAEVVIAWSILALVVVIEGLAKITLALEPKKISSAVTRTPESNFLGVREPFHPHYVHVRLKSPDGSIKTLRMHYLDEGNRESEEVMLLLHGEPFWSQSYHRLIPYLTHEGYRVIAPDLIGFGRSDKFVDYRAYSLGLHQDALMQFLHGMKLNGKKVTLVGHNWGALLGATIIKNEPELFSRLVILNTNNLPDGELDYGRFSNLSSFSNLSGATLFRKYLVYDAFFLTFPAIMRLLRNFAPFWVIYWLFNINYTKQDLVDFTAPFKRTHLDLGGAVSFPLLVPVRPDHPHAAEFRCTRQFLSQHWYRPTLIAFSDESLFPVFTTGDFIVGNRRDFFRILIPGAKVAPRIQGGHVIMPRWRNMSYGL